MTLSGSARDPTVTSTSIRPAAAWTSSSFLPRRHSMTSNPASRRVSAKPKIGSVRTMGAFGDMAAYVVAASAAAASAPTRRARGSISPGLWILFDPVSGHSSAAKKNTRLGNL